MSKKSDGQHSGPASASSRHAFSPSLLDEEFDFLYVPDLPDSGSGGKEERRVSEPEQDDILNNNVVDEEIETEEAGEEEEEEEEEEAVVEPEKEEDPVTVKKMSFRYRKSVNVEENESSESEGEKINIRQRKLPMLFESDLDSSDPLGSSSSDSSDEEAVAQDNVQVDLRNMVEKLASSFGATLFGTLAPDPEYLSAEELAIKELEAAEEPEVKEPPKKDDADLPIRKYTDLKQVRAALGKSMTKTGLSDYDYDLLKPDLKDVTLIAEEMADQVREASIAGVLANLAMQPVRTGTLQFSQAIRLQGVRRRDALRAAGISTDHTEYEYFTTLDFLSKQFFKSWKLKSFGRHTNEGTGRLDTTTFKAGGCDDFLDRGCYKKVLGGGGGGGEIHYRVSKKCAEGKRDEWEDEEDDMGEFDMLPTTQYEWVPPDEPYDKDEITLMIGTMLWGMVDSITTLGEYTKYTESLKHKDRIWKPSRKLTALKLKIRREAGTRRWSWTGKL